MTLPVQTPAETFKVNVSQLTPSTQVSSPSLAPPTAVLSQLTIGPAGPIVSEVGVAARDDGKAANTVNEKISTTRCPNDREENGRVFEATRVLRIVVFLERRLDTFGIIS